MTEFFRSLDTVLMGRKTYDVVEKMQGSKTVYPGLKNYIFSRTLPAGERYEMEFTAHDPVDVIARLKQQSGKDIWLCGGGELARHCLQQHAVDEITLGIVPRMIGGGSPVFPPGFDETEVELAEVKQFKGGVVALTYRVVYVTELRPATETEGKESAKAGRKSPARKPRVAPKKRAASTNRRTRDSSGKL
jgi:dihydrofolate reductase